MDEPVVVQGRRLEPADIDRIRELIAGNPDWSRRQLSQALSTEWDWRNAGGRLKDMAARTLLVKLQARGWIELPARRRIPPNRMTACVPDHRRPTMPVPRTGRPRPRLRGS